MNLHRQYTTIKLEFVGEMISETQVPCVVNIEIPNILNHKTTATFDVEKGKLLFAEQFIVDGLFNSKAKKFKQLKLTPNKYTELKVMAEKYFETKFKLIY